MSDTFNALLRSVLCHRDDDTPRLVLADWFQENGQEERAEFVRVQVELAKFDRYEWPTGSNALVLCREDGLRVDALHIRERELWSRHKLINVPAGFSALMGFNRDNLPSGNALYPARGFFQIAVCTAADWLAHADAVYWHPEQKVKCPECIDGNYSEGFRDSQKPLGLPVLCPHCSRSSGRIPRPCPDTAQPLRKVVVPDVLPRDCWRVLGLKEREERKGGGFWSDKWPGLEFELLAVEQAETWDQFLAVQQRFDDSSLTARQVGAIIHNGGT